MVNTIRTRFGFWYEEEVHGSMKFEAELGLQSEDKVVVIPCGSRQVCAESSLQRASRPQVLK